MKNEITSSEPQTQMVNTAVGLILASSLALWGYETIKKTNHVGSTKEAITRARNHARSNFELETEEPCLARSGGIINIGGQTLDIWEVSFPRGDRYAASYYLYSNGRVYRTHCDLDMFVAAQKFDSSNPDTYTNWPTPIKEKMKMVEEVRKQGSKCTYY